MLQKHKAILLKNTKYGETGLITKFFSKEFGLISVLSRNVRKNTPMRIGTKKGSTVGLYQILSLCDVVTKQTNNSNLQHLVELKNTPPLAYFHSNPMGVLVGSYMANLLLQFVHDDHADEDLFTFTYNYIEHLEENKLGFNKVPLHFTCHLLKITGYLPKPGFENPASLSAHTFLDDEEMAAAIQMCLSCPIDGIENLDMPNALRKKTLQYLIYAAANFLQNQKLKTVYEQLRDIMQV